MRNNIVVYWAALVLCGLGLQPARADVAALQSAVTYYQGCESLTPTVAGEVPHPAPELQPGKIGQAFLIERRTINLVEDPDFTVASTAPPGPWLMVGKPEFQGKGGLNGGSSCTVTADNFVRQVFTDLHEGSLYCVSVYARSSDGGQLQLAMKSGAAKKELQSPLLNGQYQRVSLAFVAEEPTATLTLRAAANSAQLDAVQLEADKSWPSSFMKQDHKQRGAEWIDIPARPEIYNPLHGSVAFWMKPEWLGETSLSSLGLFSAVADPSLPFSQQANLFSVSAYTDPTQKDWRNAITVIFRDKAGKVAGYSPVSFDGSLQPGQWLHLVVTWDTQPGGESISTCYLNGQKKGSLKFNSSGFAPPTKIYTGYVGGGYLDGLVDEIYLFNRPLSDDEAREVYELNSPLSMAR